MAMLGLRFSGFRNGVSELHGTVSRKLWESAWPSLPLEQIPIDSVTNGVHLPTWVSHEVSDLYDRYIGPEWRDDPAHCDWTSSAEPRREVWRSTSGTRTARLACAAPARRVADEPDFRHAWATAVRHAALT